MEDIIKLAKLFGNGGSYINLPRKGKGKRFIVLPIKYKECIGKVWHLIKSQENKKLKQILSKPELAKLRSDLKIAEKNFKISSVGTAWIKRSMLSYILDLENVEDNSDKSNIMLHCRDEKNKNKFLKSIGTKILLGIIK
ncbi:MAG: hypothetical protein U9Q69_01530 [Nanoarchaeota archaeon]|nr:hypothetical protein [Nanoarchaeota archaeon]